MEWEEARIGDDSRHGTPMDDNVGVANRGLLGKGVGASGVWSGKRCGVETTFQGYLAQVRGAEWRLLRTPSQGTTRAMGVRLTTRAIGVRPASI